jgi:hypothetical protein
MEAFHRALLDTIEVAHPNMMSFVRDLWQVASMADRDAALTAAGRKTWNIRILLKMCFSLPQLFLMSGHVMDLIKRKMSGFSQ